MLILGIESSCDETAAAVLQDGNILLSDIVATQISTHRKYGGVVPELASRKHLEAIWPVVQEAVEQAGTNLDLIDGIAVTQGPGLVGSLLIGMSFAKAISFVKKIPYVGVDHLTGHLLSVFLSETKPSFPYIALVVSGGHSSIFKVSGPLDFQLLGRTRDDAAGEAFDKVAKLLNLGYPGGPVISEKSSNGDPGAIKFPRAWLEPDSMDFSFSGIKTAVANHVNKLGQKQQNRQQDVKDLNLADICASFQEAVVEVLVEKTILAARKFRVGNVVLAGGVAANKRLREYMQQRGQDENLSVFMPPPQYCTDNAAMIALAGYHKLMKHGILSYEMDVYSRSQFTVADYKQVQTT